MSDLVINTQRRFQLPKARWDIRESMFILVSRYQNFQKFEKNSKLGSIAFYGMIMITGFLMKMIYAYPEYVSPYLDC